MPDAANDIRRRLTAGESLLLGLASSYSPLTVMGRNLAGFPHPERLIALALLVWMAATGLAVGLTYAGMQRRSAVRVVFVWVVLVMDGGRALRSFGSVLGLLIVLLTATLAFWLFRRLGDQTAAAVGIGAVAAFLGSFVLVATYEGLSNIGEDATTPGNSLDIELTSHPDIFLVVLDAYPGLVTFEALGDADRGPFVSELERRGFQTPASGWAAYPLTALSIPSLLDMRYPFDIPSTSVATTMSSFRTVSGHNEFMRTLARHGYELTVIESGWSGSSCGPLVDRCIHSPVFNEALALILHDSIVGPTLSDTLGTAFTVGSEHSMSWLLDHAGEISRDREPSLIFAHLAIPHPPFYFDSECSRVVEKERLEASYPSGDASDSEKASLFGEQVDCVDRFVLELVDKLDDDAVVVVTSDHGSARLGQLELHGEQWDEGQISERLNILISVKVRQGCKIGDTVILPNLLRRVLSCFATDAIPDLPLRMFIPPGLEVDPAIVERLVNDGRGSRAVTQIER